MKDEVSAAAHLYAEHCVTCEVCREATLGLCDEGLVLMRQFHEAINDDLARQARLRKEN